MLFYKKNKTTLNYRHDVERSRRKVINSIESVARLIGMRKDEKLDLARKSIHVGIFGKPKSYGQT